VGDLHGARQSHPSKRAEANRLRRVAIREFMTEYMADKCCVDCGIDNPVVLDFHHKPGVEKNFKIADALHYRVGLGSLQAELEKCEVLCANCHRIRHRQHKWEHVGRDSRIRNQGKSVA